MAEYRDKAIERLTTSGGTSPITGQPDDSQERVLRAIAWAILDVAEAIRENADRQDAKP